MSKMKRFRMRVKNLELMLQGQSELLVKQQEQLNSVSPLLELYSENIRRLQVDASDLNSWRLGWIEGLERRLDSMVADIAYLMRLSGSSPTKPVEELHPEPPKGAAPALAPAKPAQDTVEAQEEMADALNYSEPQVEQSQSEVEHRDEPMPDNWRRPKT